jgi:hypothetical protein
LLLSERLNESEEVHCWTFYWRHQKLLVSSCLQHELEEGAAVVAAAVYCRWFLQNMII